MNVKKNGKYDKTLSLAFGITGVVLLLFGMVFNAVCPPARVESGELLSFNANGDIIDQLDVKEFVAKYAKQFYPNITDSSSIFEYIRQIDASALYDTEYLITGVLSDNTVPWNTGIKPVGGVGSFTVDMEGSYCFQVGETYYFSNDALFRFVVETEDLGSDGMRYGCAFGIYDGDYTNLLFMLDYSLTLVNEFLYATLSSVFQFTDDLLTPITDYQTLTFGFDEGHMNYANNINRLMFNSSVWLSPSLMMPAYNEGYETGNNDGYSVGYDTGYDAGYSSAELADPDFDAGYQQAVEDLGDGTFGQNLLGATLGAPMKALNEFVLYESAGGDRLTLGLVVGGVICLSLFIAFLKIFAGG